MARPPNSTKIHKEYGMSRFVMKVDRDRDYYVEWSTVVDNWCVTGTRAEMLKHLQRDEPRGYRAEPGHRPEDRLERADQTGTSALFPNPPFEGAWADEELMVEQRGTLPRADLGRYLEAMEAGDEDRAYALLNPFEDDDDPPLPS